MAFVVVLNEYRQSGVGSCVELNFWLNTICSLPANVVIVRGTGLFDVCSTVWGLQQGCASNVFGVNVVGYRFQPPVIFTFDEIFFGGFEMVRCAFPFGRGALPRPSLG